MPSDEKWPQLEANINVTLKLKKVAITSSRSKAIPLVT